MTPSSALSAGGGAQAPRRERCRRYGVTVREQFQAGGVLVQRGTSARVSRALPYQMSSEHGPNREGTPLNASSGRALLRAGSSRAALAGDLQVGRGQRLVPRPPAVGVGQVRAGSALLTARSTSNSARPPPGVPLVAEACARRLLGALEAPALRPAPSAAPRVPAQRGSPGGAGQQQTRSLQRSLRRGETQTRQSCLGSRQAFHSCSVVMETGTWRGGRALPQRVSAAGLRGSAYTYPGPSGVPRRICTAVLPP